MILVTKTSTCNEQKSIWQKWKQNFTLSLFNCPFIYPSSRFYRWTWTLRDVWGPIPPSPSGKRLPLQSHACRLSQPASSTFPRAIAFPLWLARSPALLSNGNSDRSSCLFALTKNLVELVPWSMAPTRGPITSPWATTAAIGRVGQRAPGPFPRRPCPSKKRQRIHRLSHRLPQSQTRVSSQRRDWRQSRGRWPTCCRSAANQQANWSRRGRSFPPSAGNRLKVLEWVIASETTDHMPLTYLMEFQVNSSFAGCRCLGLQNVGENRCLLTRNLERFPRSSAYYEIIRHSSPSRGNAISFSLMLKVANLGPFTWQ